jgi:hypothetical protein
VARRQRPLQRFRTLAKSSRAAPSRAPAGDHGWRVGDGRRRCRCRLRHGRGLSGGRRPRPPVVVVMMVAAGPPGRRRRRRPGCGRTRGPGMAGEGARGQGAEAKGRSQRHDHEGLARSAQAPEREVAPTRGVHLRNPRAVTHPCMVRRLPPHPPKGCMRVPSSSEAWVGFRRAARRAGRMAATGPSATAANAMAAMVVGPHTPELRRVEHGRPAGWTLATRASRLVASLL